MLFSPSNLFFFLTLMLGSFLSISSTSWISAWIGLELNLMSFIPLITKKHSPYLAEASLKYFLIQATASSIIIISGSLQTITMTVSCGILLLALIMKLGAAPFYFWLPQVMEGLMWPQIMIITSVQKLAPLYLISYLTFNSLLSNIITISSMMSAIMGAVNGFNTPSLRKILAYSSINHMAWMLISISLNETMWSLYFLFYIVISFSIILMFNYYKMYYLNDLVNFKSSLALSLLLPITFFSLGGLPPFTGFIPKWFIIQVLIFNKSFLLLAILLASALVTLFFYTRISIFFMLFSGPKLSLNFQMLTFNNTSMMTPIIILMNSLALFLPLFFSMY